VQSPSKTEAAPRALSVVIPAFDQGERLGATLERSTEFLSEQDWDAEVIVPRRGATSYASV